MKFLAFFVVAVLGVAAAASIGSIDDADSKPNMRDQLVSALRTGLEDTIRRIKERVDVKHQSAQDLIEKANEYADRLGQLHAGAGQKTKDLIATYKQKAQDLWAKVLEKLAGKVKQVEESESAIDDAEVATPALKQQLIQVLQSGLESTIQRIKERVDQKHAKIQDLVTKASEYADRLHELKANTSDKAKDILANYKEKAQALWAKLLERVSAKKEETETREKRDVSEQLSNVKDFLSELKGTAKERFADFADYLRENWSRLSEKAKDKRDQWVNVAKEIRDHAKEMHKETVREAIEALRPHKEELGNVWREALDSAKNALKKPSTQE
jgi:uncharacterized phage infection (PIP) family protein YhgE